MKIIWRSHSPPRPFFRSVFSRLPSRMLPVALLRARFVGIFRRLFLILCFCRVSVCDVLFSIIVDPRLRIPSFLLVISCFLAFFPSLFY